MLQSIPSRVHKTLSLRHVNLSACCLIPLLVCPYLRLENCLLQSHEMVMGVLHLFVPTVFLLFMWPALLILSH